jgi:tetratricopeptide (TPR) repeat protein
MNSFYSHLSAAIGTSVLLVNVVVAQEVQPPPPSPIMTEEQTFLYSQKLFEKGDFNQGESRLQSLDHSKPGTAEWHIDYGLILEIVAVRCQQAGEIKLSQEIAQRALGRLDQAKQTTPPPATQARIYEIRGAIFLLLFSSFKEAKASYEEAVRILPDNPYAKAKLRGIDALEKQAEYAKP